MVRVLWVEKSVRTFQTAQLKQVHFTESNTHQSNKPKTKRFYHYYSTTGPSTVGWAVGTGKWLLNGWQTLAQDSPGGLSWKHQEADSSSPADTSNLQSLLFTLSSCLHSWFNVEWKYRVYSNPFWQAALQCCLKEEESPGDWPCFSLGWRGLLPSLLSLSQSLPWRLPRPYLQTVSKSKTLFPALLWLRLVDHAGTLVTRNSQFPRQSTRMLASWCETVVLTGLCLGHNFWLWNQCWCL